MRSNINAQLEKSRSCVLLDTLALLAIVYGAVFIFFDVFILDYPDCTYDWITWTFKILFNGIILPTLGYANRVSSNKMLRLTQQIHRNVTNEMNLIKQLTINTQKLTQLLIQNSSSSCINFKRKE